MQPARWACATLACATAGGVVLTPPPDPPATGNEEHNQFRAVDTSVVPEGDVWKSLPTYTVMTRRHVGALLSLPRRLGGDVFPLFAKVRLQWLEGGGGDNKRVLYPEREDGSLHFPVALDLFCCCFAGKTHRLASYSCRWSRVRTSA
jgi:hypothetical protein